MSRVIHLRGGPDRTPRGVKLVHTGSVQEHAGAAGFALTGMTLQEARGKVETVIQSILAQK